MLLLNNLVTTRAIHEKLQIKKKKQKQLEKLGVWLLKQKITIKSLVDFCLQMGKIDQLHI